MSHVNWRPLPRAILKYRDVDLGATEEVGELEEVASESREDGLVVVEVDTDEDRAYVPQVAVPTFVSDYSSRVLAARILLAPLLPPQHQRSSQRARECRGDPLDQRKGGSQALARSQRKRRWRRSRVRGAEQTT